MCERIRGEGVGNLSVITVNRLWCHVQIDKLMAFVQMNYFSSHAIYLE